MLLGGALHALLLICQPNSHDPRINDLHRLDIACGASISIFVDAVLFRHLMSVYLEFLGVNAAANPLAHGEMWMPVLAIFLRYSIRVKACIGAVTGCSIAGRRSRNTSRRRC